MRFIFRSSSFKSRDRKIIAAIDGHMCFPSNLICVVYFGRYCRKMFRPGDARRHHMTRKSSYRSFDRDLRRLVFQNIISYFLNITFFIFLLYNNGKFNVKVAVFYAESFYH